MLPARRNLSAVARGVGRVPAGIGFLSAALVLGGCAGMPAGDEARAEPSAATREGSAPETSLSRDLLYKLLVAEFAGRRGELPLAYDNYLEVARETGDPRAAEQAVRIAMFARDHERGIEAVELWTGLAPRSLEAMQIHAALLIRAGMPEAAAEAMRGLIAAVEEESPGQGLQLASEVLSRERDGANAVRVMEMLVADRPEDPRAQFAFGHLLARGDDLERARIAFERVLAAEPGNVRAVVLLARLHQQLGDLPEALAVLERALEALPEARAVRLTYARLLVETQRSDEAREQFERLVSEDPGDGDVRYAFALLLLQTHDHERAEEEFRRLTRSIEHRDRAWFRLGEIGEARGDGEAAIAAFSRVQDADNRLNAQLRVAMLLSEAGRVDEARARLHALNGRNLRESVRLYRVDADILVHHSRFDEAMQVLSAAIEHFPFDSELLYARAMLAEQLDDLAQLERDLKRILEREPDNADALNALGYTLADRTDRIDEAYRLVKRAYDLRPDSHYIIDSMGWVMYRMGRHQDALRYLRRAMEIDPDPEIAAHLGEVLWVTGNEEEAREVWGGALQTTPEDEHLLDMKKRFGF